MKRIVTNWENDMIDSPEEKVKEFLSAKQGFWDFPEVYEIKFLSGLKHRDISEIYKSLEESRVIIMQPSLLDATQIATIVKAISHPIHVNNYGAQRRWDIRDFIFLSANPFEDLELVVDSCNEVMDKQNEHSLTKILRCCEVHFYGFAGEHYELKKGFHYRDSYAVRYK